MSKLRRQAQTVALLERVDVWEPRPGWRDRRGCLGQPVDWWFEGGPKSKGARICDACPVRMCCLTVTIREERALANVEDDIAGHRCISAHARRNFLSNERRGNQ